MVCFDRNQKNKKLIIFLLLALIIIFNYISNAEEEKPVIDDNNNKPGGFSRFLSKYRGNVGRGFRSIALKIDEYFYRNRIYEKPRENKLMLRLDFFKEESKCPEFREKVILCMYFHIGSVIVDNSRIDKLPDADLIDKNTEITTGLNFYIHGIEKIMLFFGSGITIRNKKTVFYSRFYLIKHNIKIKDWNANFRQSVFWYSDERFGELTQVDFDYTISEKMLLRMISAGLYSQVSKGFELEQSFILSYDFVKAEKIIFWRVSGFAHTEPFYATDKYRTDIVYRVQLITPWMFFDIGPQLEFPAEENLKGIPGVRLGIDSIF